jgi:hypothetical protein
LKLFTLFAKHFHVQIAIGFDPVLVVSTASGRISRRACGFGAGESTSRALRSSFPAGTALPLARRAEPKKRFAPTFLCFPGWTFPVAFSPPASIIPAFTSCHASRRCLFCSLVGNLRLHRRSFLFPMGQVRQEAERVGRSPPRRSCNSPSRPEKVSR